MIGETIIVSVERIERDRVQLGITAPVDVAVHREEIWRRLQEEKHADGE